MSWLSLFFWIWNFQGVWGTKWKNHGNSRGVGGVMRSSLERKIQWGGGSNWKNPPWGGGMDIFWNHTFLLQHQLFNFRLPYLFGYKPTLAISRDPKLLAQKINLIDMNWKCIILAYKLRAILGLDVYYQPWNFRKNTIEKLYSKQ